MSLLTWSWFQKKKEEKNALYLSVNVCSTKVLFYWGHYILVILYFTGLPFYMVIWATRKSSLLQCKESTFISQLFYDPEYWSGPGNRTHDLQLSSQHALPTELTLPRFLCVLIKLCYDQCINHFFYQQEIELVFKPHPKDHDPETVAQQTRYIKTTANASGVLAVYFTLKCF